MGTAFGGYKSRDSVPALVEDTMNGKIDVKQYITHRFKFEDLNQCFDALHHGDCLRGVMYHHNTPIPSDK